MRHGDAGTDTEKGQAGVPGSEQCVWTPAEAVGSWDVAPVAGRAAESRCTYREAPTFSQRAGVCGLGCVGRGP